MLKFKNFFLMGLMVAAVGMFGLACETDPVDPIEPEAYTATIIGGYFFEDEFTPPWSSPTYYYEGDTVNIFAAEPDGKEFDSWTISGANVRFAYGTDRYDPIAYFIMPGRNVTITANFDDEGGIDIDTITYVRFSWRTADQGSISSIAANYDEVLEWYLTVYMAEDYVEEDATDIPILAGKGGSPELPINIYSSTLGNTEYKSTYLEISGGEYTAVCTIEDEYGYVDVVANYGILSYDELVAMDKGVEGYLYTEIAFDVGTFLAGEEDDDWETDDDGNSLGPWFWDITDDPDAPPILAKKPVKKLVKVIKKDNVTYYVLHRAKKV